MPSPGAVANRRLLVYLIAASGLVAFFFVFLSGSGDRPALAYSQTPIHHVSVQGDTLKGGAIMGKLGNETLK